MGALSLLEKALDLVRLAVAGGKEAAKAAKKEGLKREIANRDDGASADRLRKLLGDD